MPVITTLERVDSTPDLSEESPSGGCGNRLLVMGTILALFVLFLASVGLAGLAGWRDGHEIAQTRQAATLVAYVGVQATQARQDCDQGNYELCYTRCEYIATQQPSFPGMAACMAAARIGLSATPAPTVSPTVMPTASLTTASPAASAPATQAAPPPGTAAVTGSGDYSPADLFARAQDAIRTSDYESAMKWLEALRGIDAEFHRKEVEDMLVKTYLTLAQQYKNQDRLSEMIIVVRKAQKIQSVDDTGWSFEATVADYYLSAKGYLDAQNYALADQVFNRLMAMTTTYRDTKILACQAFSGANDTTALKKWCQ